MILSTDGQGHAVIKASGEDGRVVLFLTDGSTLIINERHGDLFTSQAGRIDAGQIDAGRLRGIVKEARGSLSVPLALAMVIVMLCGVIVLDQYMIGKLCQRCREHEQARDRLLNLYAEALRGHCP